MRSDDSPITSEFASALALFAWYPYHPNSPSQTHIDPLHISPTEILQCRICRRRVGLWSFGASDMGAKAFDLVDEHHDWCPSEGGVAIASDVAGRGRGGRGGRRRNCCGWPGGAGQYQAGRVVPAGSEVVAQATPAACLTECIRASSVVPVSYCYPMLSHAFAAVTLYWPETSSLMRLCAALTILVVPWRRHTEAWSQAEHPTR